MKHLPIIITLLISGLWIHTVNAESPSPERLQTPPRNGDDSPIREPTP